MNETRGGPFRFGFVGAGWIAHRALAPAVHASTGAVLQAAAARDAERAATLEPAGRCYTDYRDLLADPDVDVVYLSLSNDLHHRWTLAALAAGKHVLCEKPLGLNLAQVTEMHDAARAADRLLVEAFWYRWHPRTRRLEELIRTGTLGPIRELEADFSFPGADQPAMAGNYRLDPGRGGGALYDVGCYTISAAHLALGPDLVVEQAEAVFGPSGVDLAATVRLSAGSSAPGQDSTGRGAVAVARCGIAVPERQALSVTGEAARVDFTLGEAFTTWQQPCELTITGPDGTVQVERFAPVDAYRLMVESVAAAVRGRPGFMIEPEFSLAVSGTLDAARAAMTTLPGRPRAP